jgi:hypothetical protein
MSLPASRGVEQVGHHVVLAEFVELVHRANTSGTGVANRVPEVSTLLGLGGI